MYLVIDKCLQSISRLLINIQGIEMGLSSGIRESDAKLLITRLSNPHTNDSTPRKPSKSDLIGEWHKSNLYLGTDTIGIKPLPMNNNLRRRSILDWPHEVSCTLIKRFQSFKEQRKGEYLTHTHNNKLQQNKVIFFNNPQNSITSKNKCFYTDLI